MALASPQISIAELRQRLECTETPELSSLGVLPFGVAPIDRHLPKGGLTLGHLHEVIEAGPSSEYAGVASLFIAGISRAFRDQCCGVCADAISLLRRSRVSVYILIASFTARHGKTAMCCRRWRKGFDVLALPASLVK
jgi:hypothetical protein